MSKKLKEYDVKVSYTFVGKVKVRADSKRRAVDIVKSGFGGLNVEVGKSSWESTDPEDEGITDWNIDQKPERDHIY